MSKIYNMIGKRFGMLTVIKELQERSKDVQKVYKCVCDCGNYTNVRGRDLRSKNTRSCGCLHKRAITTHDKTNSRVYRIYWDMKTRCYNSKHKSYKDYGGRGIEVCNEWLNNFMVFYDWSISHGYKDNLTIDRIDVNGNYEPNNCRWVTMKEQQNNTRTNVNLTYGGITHTISEWSNILSINYSTLYNRRIKGWNIDDILTKRSDEKRLYSYQVKLLADLYEYNKCGMFLEMGLGKSVLGTIKATSYNKPVLIISPKSVISQWEGYFKEWASYYNVYDLTNAKQLKSFMCDNNNFKMGIINYQSAWRRPELLNLKGYTLILDESHNIANNTSKQSKFTMKLKYENLILLSGTPCNGMYHLLYTQLKLLGLHMNKRSYEDRYCNFFEMKNAGVKFRVLSKKSPYKNIDELKATIKNLGGRFMKTNDVIELPEQRFIDIAVPETKQYKAFMVNDYIDLGDREYIAGSPTEKLLYSRYLCGADNANKIDVLTTLLEGIDDRVIIFYNFNNEHDVLTKLCKKLKRKAFTCNGNVKQVDDFKQHDKSILLVQYRAGATGLNLQFCNKVVYFTPPLSSNLYEQSKARTWRVGQKSKCTYWILKSGVECDILNSLDKKQDYNIKLFKG